MSSHEPHAADTPKRPLEGVKIIEFSSYLTGPYTSMMLGDLGAQIIKVEQPGGDSFRKFGHSQQGLSSLWCSSNRGKRSMVLDLKQADDLATMKQLLTTADVLIENWRPHVADSLGLDQKTVQALNPKLVRLSITGYGYTGPLSNAPAFDSLIQGHTGMLDLAADDDTPNVAPYWVVDKVVATFGAQAVLAALYQREKTGAGSHVSLPMLDVTAYFNFPDIFQHRTFIGDERPRAPAFSPVIPTADGHILLAPVSGAQLSRTLKALERPDIKERMLAMDDSVEMVKMFYREVGLILQTRPSAHWLALFESFDLPVGPVRKLDEHLNDPQVLHNALYHEIDSPAGPVRAVRYPGSFDGVQLRPMGPLPRPGEHTAQIKAELAAR